MISSSMSFGFNFSFSRSQFESSTRACSVAVGLNSISDFLRCYSVPSIGGAFSDQSIYSTSATELFFLHDDHKRSKNNVALLLPHLVSAAIIPSALPKFHHRINSTLRPDMSNYIHNTVIPCAFNVIDGQSFILSYRSSICAHWKWLLVCGLREKLLGYYHLDKKNK